MRVLTLLDYYLPGTRFGGPVRTLANMVEQLPENDYCIVTRDRDVGDLAPYPHIHQGEWNRVGRASVFYAPPDELHSIRMMRRWLHEVNPDVVYVNSFFSPLSIRYVFARRLGLLPHHPVVLAPRGEFSRGALSLKRRKKQLFVTLAKATGMYRDLIWQASSPSEAAEIRGLLGEAACTHIAPDLTTNSMETGVQRLCKNRGKARFVFISRITRMKNLAFALDRMCHVKGSAELTIFGGIDDARYWQECQELIARLPQNILVRYAGVLPAEHVAEELLSHDFFILPTLGENFGHAIFEALSAGCPPLISDQTLWRDLESSDAGWDLPLHALSGWEQILTRCIEMDAEEHRRLSQGAQAFAAKYIQTSDAREHNLDLFIRCLAAGEPRA